MDWKWSKRDAAGGCSNCQRVPDQVAVITFGGLVTRFCFDCLRDELGEAVSSLIDEYDGYDDE